MAWSPPATSGQPIDMNPLLGFYREEHPDDRGRWLTGILGKDDDWLEYTHDYIQATDGAIIKGPNWFARKDNWFVEPTHNDLRITRILTSLSLLGRRDDARQFLACLQTLRISEADCGFSDEALGYWRSAIGFEVCGQP